MALSHRIIFRKELQNFMLEIKEGKPEDEILEKYLTKIWNISNERKRHFATKWNVYFNNCFI